MCCPLSYCGTFNRASASSGIKPREVSPSTDKYSHPSIAQARPRALSPLLESLMLPLSFTSIAQARPRALSLLKCSLFGIDHRRFNRASASSGIKPYKLAGGRFVIRIASIAQARPRALSLRYEEVI